MRGLTVLAGADQEIFSRGEEGPDRVKILGGQAHNVQRYDVLKSAQKGLQL